MGVVIQKEFLNREVVNRSELFRTHKTELLELVLLSGMTLEYGILKHPGMEILLHRNDMLRVIQYGIIPLIDEVLTGGDVYDLSAFKDEKGIRKEELMSYLSEMDCRRILIGYFALRGDIPEYQRIWDNIETHNRIAVSLSGVTCDTNAALFGVNKLIAHYNVENITACQVKSYAYSKEDEKFPYKTEYFVELKNPIFYSLSLLILALNQILLYCDQKPEDFLNTTKTVDSMKVLFDQLSELPYHMEDLLERPIAHAKQERFANVFY